MIVDPITINDQIVAHLNFITISLISHSWSPTGATSLGSLIVTAVLVLMLPFHSGKSHCREIEGVAVKIITGIQQEAHALAHVHMHEHVHTYTRMNKL